MLVDLVAAPTIVPGPSGGAETPLRAPVPAAPKIEGVRPKAVTPPPDELESRIAQPWRSCARPIPPCPRPTMAPAPAMARGGGYALADFVRAQILRRWWPQLESDAARGMPVAIRLKLSRAGVISDVQIVDQARFANDKLFRNMALSARNAALLASPISLPPGKYDAVMDIAITLDPHAVLRMTCPASVRARRKPLADVFRQQKLRFAGTDSSAKARSGQIPRHAKTGEAGIIIFAAAIGRAVARGRADEDRDIVPGAAANHMLRAVAALFR